MTLIRCLHCNAETSNGLALCELCRRKAEADLEFLPIYFRNLARWRPGRTGSRSVPGSRVLYDGTPRGTGDRIGDALDEAKAMLVTRAQMLADDRAAYETPAEAGTDAATVALLCASLAEHLTFIATTDWCGDLVRDLGHHEERLRALTETAVPGWYAGGCKICGSGTYVVPGLTWVTCRACGSTTYARDHLETILEEAESWTATPKRLAEAIVALVDTEQSIERLRDRIRRWGDRGQLPVIRRLDIDGDEVGPKRYRLGDALAQLRQPEVVTAEAAS